MCGGVIYMKKQLLTGAAALSLGIASFAGSTFAVDGITTESVLRACLEQEESATCTINSDIAITAPIIIKDTITLNLNSKTISVDVANWDILNKDTNKFKAHDRGMITVNHGANLTINGAGKITTGDTDIYSAIRMTSETDDSKEAILTVNGATLEGYYYGIVGNGSEHRGNTIIDLNGATVKGLNIDDSFGIYHPQLGVLSIDKGSEVAGAGGIAIKSGTLNIKDGIVTGMGAFKDTVSYNNGANHTGSALLIESNKGYSDNVKITISGGVLISEKGYVIDEFKASDDAPLVKLFTITGGDFSGDKGVIRSHGEFPGLIKGGTFSVVKDELDAFLNAYVDLDKSYSYKDATLTIHEAVRAEDLPEGHTIIMEHTASLDETTVEAYQDILDDIAEYPKDFDAANFKMIQQEDITIIDGDGGLVHETTEPVKLHTVIEEANRTPAEGYSRNWYVVRAHETGTGTDYAFLDCEFDEATGILSFESKLFSTFVIGYTDTKVEVPGAPKTGFFTSASATAKASNVVLAAVAGVITTLGALIVAKKAARR